MLHFISLQIPLIPLESKCEPDRNLCKNLFSFAFILNTKMQSFDSYFIGFRKLYFVSL